MRSTLFEVFGIPIRAYGLMIIIGFALGLWRTTRVCRKRGISPEQIYDLSLIVFVSGLIGARLLFVLLNLRTEGLGRFYAVWEGGLSFHGGIIAGLIAGYIYTRAKRLNFWVCADLIAPALAIGYAFTRIGCFLNGCCYGAPTTLPWAVQFHEHGFTTPPSHPTQIYAFLANIVIFALLTRLEKMGRKPGFVFTGYIGLYGVYRFLVEYLRAGYTAQVWLLGLTQAQWASIAMVLLSVALIVSVFRHRQKKA